MIKEEIYKNFSFIKGEYFQYTFDSVISQAINGTATVTVTIDNDFHFVITNVFGTSFETATPSNIVDFTLQMNDSSTSKNFFSQDTNSALVVSNARRTINPIPIHRLAPMRTTITATITNNLSGVITNTYLTLRGYKLYSPKAQRLMLKKYAMASPGMAQQA